MYVFEAVCNNIYRQLWWRYVDTGAEELKSKYLLKRNDEKHTVNVSNGDHMGIKWWSKMRGVSMTASLHEMIITFLAPKLQEAHQEVIFHAVKEKVLPEEALDGPLRRLLNVPRGLTRRRDLKTKRKLRAKLPKST